MIKNKKLKWYSYKQVFGKDMKNPKFKKAYKKEMKRLKEKGQVIFYTGTFHWFTCKHCKKLNILSSPDGVKVLRKWKKIK